jgi:hypothetical protein
LARAARSHWHPSVRNAAQKALRALQQAPTHIDQYARQQLLGLYDRALDCEHPAPTLVTQPSSQKLYTARDASALAKLRYPATIMGYGPADEAKTSTDGVIVVTPETIVRQEQIIKQTPHVALRTDGGWLVGSNRGEWGGELVWLGDNGTRQTILARNIQDLHQLHGRIITVTGPTTAMCLR